MNSPDFPYGGAQDQEQPVGDPQPRACGEPEIPALADLIRDWMAANARHETEAGR